MSDLDTIDGMKKKVETVPVHARLPQSDVEEVDRAANEELTSRSNMLARIVREWVKGRLKTSPKKK